MVVAVAAVWINQAGPGPAAAPDAASASSVGPSSVAARARLSDAALTEMLDAMAGAVTHESRADFLDAAGSTPWARQTWRTLEALRVAKIELSYVPAGSLSPPTADVTVTVAWTPGRQSVYQGATTVPRDVTFTVGATGAGETAVIGAGSSGDSRVPVWLLGAVHVSSPGDATLVSAGRSGSEPAVDVLVRRALAAVRTQLGGSELDTHRRVVVVVPAGESEAVRQGGRELRGAAAITTTVDGSARATAPVHVVLNPAVFDRLRPRGARVVLAHEVTHAVTGAAASPMPLWVAEGFADWVALRYVGVPYDVAAGGLLSAVRQDGPPAELPTNADFAGHEAASQPYEAAWTVFRVLSRRAGDRAVIGFYADVLAGRPVATALETSAGISVAALTRAWRTNLRRLAHG